MTGSIVTEHLHSKQPVLDLNVTIIQVVDYDEQTFRVNPLATLVQSEDLDAPI